MIKKLKNFFLVLAVCATVIENLPYISAYIGLLYIILSILDFLEDNNLKSQVVIFPKGRKIVHLWIILFCFVTIITIVFPTQQRYPLFNYGWIRAIVFFTLILKDTYNNVKLIYKLLLFYGITAMFCFILIRHGIGVEISRGAELGEGRLSFFGSNENKMAMVYVFVIAEALSLFFVNIKKGVKWVVYSVSVILILSSSYVIANMGSRGALIIVLVFVVYIALSAPLNNSRVKIVIFMFSGLAFYGFYKYFTSIEIMSARMELLNEGNFGGRTDLNSIVFQTFMEHPMGVGLNAICEEIGKHYNHNKTPHNLFLYMLSAGGIFAFILVVIIFISIIVYVWKESKKTNRVLPILLLIAVTIDSLKSGAALTCNINYIYLAISMTLAATPKLQSQKTSS